MVEAVRRTTAATRIVLPPPEALHVTDDTGDNFWTDMSGWVVIRVRTA